MKLLLMFLTAFALCFVAGAFHGKRFLEQDFAIEKSVFDGAKPTLVNETLYLTKTVNGEIINFSVETNELTNGPLPPPNESIRSEIWAKMFSPKGDFIPMFVGGATAGMSIKDIIKKPDEVKRLSRARAGSILITTIGVLSGYSLGYWSATVFFLPSEDSAEYIDIISSEKKWTEFEPYVYRRILSLILININFIEENGPEHMPEYNDEHIAFRGELGQAFSLADYDEGDKSGKLTSLDFIRLSMINNSVSDFKDEIIEHKDAIPKWRLYIGWFFAFLFVAFVIYYFWKVRKVEQSTKHKSRMR